MSYKATTHRKVTLRPRRDASLQRHVSMDTRSQQQEFDEWRRSLSRSAGDDCDGYDNDPNFSDRGEGDDDISRERRYESVGYGLSRRDDDWRDREAYDEGDVDRRSVDRDAAEDGWRNERRSRDAGRWNRNTGWKRSDHFPRGEDTTSRWYEQAYSSKHLADTPWRRERRCNSSDDVGDTCHHDEADGQDRRQEYDNGGYSARKHDSRYCSNDRVCEDRRHDERDRMHQNVDRRHNQDASRHDRNNDERGRHDKTERSRHEVCRRASEDNGSGTLHSTRPDHRSKEGHNSHRPADAERRREDDCGRYVPRNNKHTERGPQQDLPRLREHSRRRDDEQRRPDDRDKCRKDSRERRRRQSRDDENLRHEKRQEEKREHTVAALAPRSSSAAALAALKAKEVNGRVRPRPTPQPLGRSRSRDVVKLQHGSPGKQEDRAENQTKGNFGGSAPSRSPRAARQGKQNGSSGVLPGDSARSAASEVVASTVDHCWVFVKNLVPEAAKRPLQWFQKKCGGQESSSAPVRCILCASVPGGAADGSAVLLQFSTAVAAESLITAVDGWKSGIPRTKAQLATRTQTEAVNCCWLLVRELVPTVQDWKFFKKICEGVQRVVFYAEPKGLSECLGMQDGQIAGVAPTSESRLALVEVRTPELAAEFCVGLNSSLQQGSMLAIQISEAQKAAIEARVHAAEAEAAAEEARLAEEASGGVEVHSPPRGEERRQHRSRSRRQQRSRSRRAPRESSARRAGARSRSLRSLRRGGNERQRSPRHDRARRDAAKSPERGRRMPKGDERSDCRNRRDRSRSAKRPRY